MNLREFFKKLRSPFGTSMMFLTAIVTLALAVMPFLIREDAGKIQPIRDTVTREASLDIPGSVKAISAAPAEKSQDVKGNISDAATEHVQKPDGSSAVRPQPPTPFGHVETGTRYAKDGRSSDTGRNSVSAKILIIDGETAGTQKQEFVSERFAPYGRLISCKMVNTVESGDTDTPLIAVVIEDLWWINARGEKKLIIPAGTEVYGTVNGAKPMRNRLTTGSSFILVWQATSNMTGFELQLKGIALEKSTHPENRMLAAITDMSAGIPGQVMSNENLSKFLMYTLAFGQGLAQGYQTNEVYTDSGVTVTTQDGTTKNALARGAETLAQVMLQDVSQMIAKESYYIRVPSGTEFYIYVQQVINLDDAQIADTLLNKLEEQKIQGPQKKSYKNVLNAFSGSRQ